MRSLILYAALLSAVAGYKTPSYAGGGLLKESTSSPTELTTIKTEDASATSEEASSSAPSSSSTQSHLIEEVVSELPVSLPPLPLEEIELPKRRIITYDQRQEGQYNIRADLDNFMIVLVPPSASEGLSLLDLLTKSSLRRTSHTSKGKKKHYSSSTSFKPESSKYRQSLKSDLNNQNLNFLNLRANEQYNNGLAAARQGEFIDGRSPYHVDISSLNEEEIQARLNPDRQVDVLPPPYPIAYPHLMKPYHLEAESSLLPPSEIGLQNTESSQSQNAGYYRFARYIKGDNFLDTNRVTSSNRLGSPSSFSFRRQQLPIYRTDQSLGAAQIYPPLDIPNFNYAQKGRNFDVKSFSSKSDDLEGRQSIDSDFPYDKMLIVPSGNLPLEEDLVELELNSDSLLDIEAKALLSDGIERCAPGKRRDSYGVCREIEGY